MNFQIARKISLIVGACATLAACASGPTLSESESAQIAPAPDETRIVVYRNSILGAAIQPLVAVNGQQTGRCTANGVFFVDVPKGQYRISAATEVERAITVDTTNANIAYVRCSIGLGLIAGRPKFEVVPNETGRAESAGLSHTGTF